MRKITKQGGSKKRRSAWETAKYLLGVMLGTAVVLSLPLGKYIWEPIPYAEATSDSLSSNAILIGDRTSDRVINNDDRGDADADMLYFMQSLEVRYQLDEKVMENVHKVFDSAVYYIANTEMSVADLWSYVASTKSLMESTAVAQVTQSTSEFLQVGDNWSTPTVSYGQRVAIVLPVINFGTEELNDLIVEPQTSTLVTEWPLNRI